MGSPTPKVTTFFFDSDSDDGEDYGYAFPSYAGQQSYLTRPGFSSGFPVSPPSGVRNPGFGDLVLETKEVPKDDDIGYSIGVGLTTMINQVIEENAKSLLHSVEVASAMLTQLETRTCHIESRVGDLKISNEYYNSRTNRKLKQLEDAMEEVLIGVKYLKDKQDIAVTHLKLANLKLSRTECEPENQKTNIHVAPSLSKPAMSHFNCYQSDPAIPASSAIVVANPFPANTSQTPFSLWKNPPLSPDVTRATYQWPSSSQEVDSSPYTSALSYQSSTQLSHQPTELFGRSPFSPQNYPAYDQLSSTAITNFHHGNSNISGLTYPIRQNCCDGSAYYHGSSQVQSSEYSYKNLNFSSVDS